MSGKSPNLQEYVDLSQDAYDLDTVFTAGGTYTPPDGYTVIAESNTLGIGNPAFLADGFAAVALRDSYGNVIIINEGTLIGTSAFRVGTLLSDHEIGDGDPRARSLVDARLFALNVANKVGSGTKIFTTGHSLGGIEAQAEAVSLEGQFAGGATFGATGRPGQLAPGGPALPATMVNYVDYGDPVGNTADDTANANPVTPSPMYHYGTVTMVGNPSNAQDIINAQKYLNNATVLDSFSLQSGYGGGVADFYADLAAKNLAAALKYHSLDNEYTADLNVPVPPPIGLGGVATLPPDWEDEEYSHIYGNVDVSQFQDETVENGETATSPYFTSSYNPGTNQITIDQTGNVATAEGIATSGGVTTLSVDPDTGLVSSAVYDSEDGSIYTETFDETTATLETLEVNENNGASYQTNYTYNSDGSITALTNTYSAAHLSGTHQTAETTKVSASGQSSTDLTLYAASGGGVTFDAGTFDGASQFTYYSGAGSYFVTTSEGDDIPGFLTLNTVTGADSWTLPETFGLGLTINLPGMSGDVVTPAAAGSSPIDALVNTLSELGFSTSDSDLTSRNFAYLNPTVTPYTVGVDDVEPDDDGTEADVIFSVGDTPGAQVTGLTTASLDGGLTYVPAYNILEASDANLAQGSISNIQELDIEGTVTLTNAQWNSAFITGGGAIVAADGGTWDLNADNVDPDAVFTSLTAQGWGGTELIGDDSNGQTLIASSLGNDTLDAGDGSADVLVAGEGQDTLEGGGGGDTFVASNAEGLASGTQIIGNGSGNTLEASGDISGADIEDIQTLHTSDPTGLDHIITLTADQLGRFSSVTGGGTIEAATGGVYNISTSATAKYNMTALSDDGTQLTGNNANNETLAASTTGTDTLHAGNGSGDELVAGGGVDTLIGGSGGDTFVAPDGLAAGSSVTGNGTGNTLEVVGDISGDEIDGIQTLEYGGTVTLTQTQYDSFSTFTSLEAGSNIDVLGAGTYTLAGSSSTSITASSDGGTTLIGNAAAGEILSASASGNDTITAGNGAADILIAGSGIDTLTAGTGAGDTISAGDDNTVTAGAGAGDAITAGDDNTITANGNTATVTIGNGNTVTLNGNSDTIAITGTGNTINMLGTGDSVTDSSTGGNTFVVGGTGAGTAALNGAGADIYEFVSTFGADTIDNGNGGGSIPVGEVLFGSGVTEQNLWFTQSGNNLVVDLMGTTESVTIDNWFSGAGNEVASINVADGNPLNSANVAALVGAMATYQAANPSFDPTAVSTLPSDTTLQAAVAAAWHLGGAISDSAAVVASELDYLQSLVAASTLTSITLTDSSRPTLTITAAQLTSDAGALAAIVSPYYLAVTGVAAGSAATVAAETNVASVAASDTSANVTANLDALQTLAAASELGTITLTDTTLLTVTETQFTSDATALGLLATGTSLEVTNVLAADAATVATNTSVISITVFDSSMNILANIAALETLAASGELESIAFTDSGTPALTFTASQVAADINALRVVTGSFTLSVSDTAANVATNIDALGALASEGSVTSITLTDGGTPTLTISAVQAADDAAALSLISGTYLIAISDTAADVAANIDALQALATAGTLGSITLTDTGTPNLSIAETQLSSDAGALATIAGTYTLGITDVLAADAASVAAETNVTSVAVSDTGANVAANLDALQTLVADSVLSSITLTDTTTPTLAITAAQLTDDATMLGDIAGAYSLAITGVSAANAATVAAETDVTSVSISDTAANVSANIDELGALGSAGELGTITLTDSGTPTLSLTQAQLAGDAGAIAAITGSYDLSITAVLAGSAASVAAETGVTSVSVSDTAENILANLSELQTLAADSKLTSITLINSGTPTLTITYTQLTGDATALGLITSAHDLAVTSVLAANAATAAAVAHVTSVSVSDSVANVASHIDSLQTAFATGNLTTIALTDGGTPTLTITGAQFTNDAGAIGTIASAYHMTVTAALSAIASTLNGNSHVTSVTVTDTAANVSANFAGLQSLVPSKLTTGGITLTDGGTPTLSLTYIQLTSSTGIDILGDISGGAYHLAISGVAITNITTVFGNTHVTSIAVSDTAANISSNLNGVLETRAANSTLTGITVTNNTTAVAVTYTQLTSTDVTAIGLFTGTYSFAVSAVSAANAATVAAISHVASISVSDTSANVATNIDSLQTVAAAAKLTTITFSSGTTMTLTAAQGANDAAAIEKISGTWTLTISDTSANVVANLNGLQTLETGIGTTKFNSIALTDGTPTLTITAAQGANDAGAIEKISGSYTVVISDSAANVATNLNGLQTLETAIGTTKFNSIALTDGGTPNLAITGTQYTSDAIVIGKISPPYTMTVSAVGAASASTVGMNTHVTSFTVSDTAALIGTNLDAIEGQSAKITSITVTNNTVPVTFTYTQLGTDATALGLFTGTYSFNVTAVSVANSSTVLSHSHVTAINISDTAANVQSNIGTLQTYLAASQLTGIVLTNGGTPAMTLNATQGVSDAGAIGKITSAYALTISDTAANVQADLDNLQTLETAIGSTKFSAVTLTDGTEPTITISAAQGTNDGTVINKITSAFHLTVSDLAANVWSNIVGLVAINAKITTIVLTDGTTPSFTLTGAQYTTDNPVLTKITSAYHMTVSAVTAANATTVGGNGHVTSFTVSDSNTNIGTNFTGLETESAGTLASITISSGTVITITDTQYTNGSMAATQALITNTTYSINVTAVSIANASTVLSGSHVTAVNVSDTAANVQANIATLQTYAAASQLTGIVFTDSGTAMLTFTAAQFSSDSTAIGKFSGTYDITVTGVLAANVASVVTNTHVTALTVVDSAANVAANIATLQTDNAKITSTTLTDGGTPSLALTAAQTGDTAALGDIVSAYNITVSDTAAHVITSLAALQVQAAATKLASITLTDSGTPVLAVTGAQLNTDSGAISKIGGTYNETVTADANTTETLAGTGTINTISFTSEAQGVTANLSTGTATTVHGTTTNTYTLSSFSDIIGSTHADTLTAGSSGSVMTGDGNTGGADTYVLNASSGIDVAKDTYTNLNSTTISNFSALDGIDLTNLTFSGGTLGFVENGANTQGTLTLTSGTHTAALTLLGQYTTASFQEVSDGGSGTLVAMASTTNLTAILAAAQHG